MVVADPHQIEQVFLNIINNAVDAILETGRPGKLKIRVVHRERPRVHAVLATMGRASKILSEFSILSTQRRMLAKERGWG